MILEPHTHCWFGPGNVTAAGWKLGKVQDQDEGHDHGQGEHGADDEPGVSGLSDNQVFGSFVHRRVSEDETQSHVKYIFEISSQKVS